MLIRRLKKGDSLTIGNSVIQVRKATDENLTLVIDAPDGVEILHIKGADGAEGNTPNETSPRR